MDQAELMQIALVERQARELEGHLEIVSNQIIELEDFIGTIEALISSKERDMLASLGKRVFVKTRADDFDKLFVEVGAGVIVKKTPKETADIIKEQIKRFKEARIEISGQLQMHHMELENFMNKVRGENEETSENKAGKNKNRNN